MKNLKATCQTDGCNQKGVTHEFQSDVIYTICGACNQEITDLIIEDVTDAGAAEAN